MFARDGLPVALSITGKNLLSARANLILLGGFFVLLSIIWIKGAFVFAFQVFLFLYPHIFLFLAQDMFRDEVDSGALENLLFVGGGYKSYFRWKIGIIGAGAVGIGLILFAAFSIYGCAAHQFAAVYALQLAAGILAGLYYQSLAGFLSFFFKGGTNTLVVILGQALGLFGFLLAATQRLEWLERLTSSSLPGLAAELEALALVVIGPNIIVVRRSWWSSLAVGLLAGLFFSLQLLKIRALELRK